jgi:hypothetical protein
MTFSKKSYNSIGVLLRRLDFKMLSTILFIIAVLPAAKAEKRSQRKIIAEFEHSGQLNLSHVVVDDDENRFFSGRQHRWRSAGNGDIYLAGGNVLYQLDRQLRLKHRIKTGLLKKSINVYFSICFVSKKKINTYLKLEIRVACREFLAFKFVVIVSSKQKR